MANKRNTVIGTFNGIRCFWSYGTERVFDQFHLFIHNPMIPSHERVFPERFSKTHQRWKWKTCLFTVNQWSSGKNELKKLLTLAGSFWEPFFKRFDWAKNQVYNFSIVLLGVYTVYIVFTQCYHTVFYNQVTIHQVIPQRFTITVGIRLPWSRKIGA